MQKRGLRIKNPMKWGKNENRGERRIEKRER
jgi:hypothetical protein